MKTITLFLALAGFCSAAELTKFDRVIPMHSMLYVKKTNSGAPLGTPTGGQKDIHLNGQTGEASSSLGSKQGAPLKADPNAKASIRFADGRATGTLQMTSEGKTISVNLKRTQAKAGDLRFGALTYDEIISGTTWTDYDPKTKGVWTGKENRDGAELEYILVWASERNYLLQIIGRIPSKNLSFGEFLYGLEHDIVIEAGND